MKPGITSVLGLALLMGSTVLSAQGTPPPSLRINDKDYFEAPAVNILAFSNWYDGLFADAKIGGVEIIQRGMRTATNGDVRLSATPGQWDPAAALVNRKVDTAASVIDTTLRYAQHDWQYIVRVERRGSGAKISVILDKPLPAPIAGKAGFNLEFLPSA